MKIVITPRGFANYGLDKVKEMEEKGYEVSFNNTGKAYTKEQFYEYCHDADGIIVGVESCDREFIDSCPNLKAIVKFGVGTDNIDIPYANSKGIFVGRTAGSNSRSVAETAIAYMLADSKNLYDSISCTRNQRWDKLNGYEVLNRTVGIIGFGAVGKLVAEMASALGMKALIYDAFPIDEKLAEKMNAVICEPEEIYEKADFVTVHIPLTEETRNYISLEQMKKMKKTAVLINTARGGVVNEDDLYTALTEHIIRSAYFDVFSSEPPLKEEKLLKVDNFFLTPHIASRSAEAEINTAVISTRVILEALEKYR